MYIKNVIDDDISVTEFLPHYDVHCDLALNRCTVTMNLQKYVFGSPSVVFYHWKSANLISSLIVSYSLESLKA